MSVLAVKMETDNIHVMGKTDYSPTHSFSFTTGIPRLSNVSCGPIPWDIISAEDQGECKEKDIPITSEVVVSAVFRPTE